MAKGVSYNDSTPSLTYTYNRLGNQATVADTTGTRTLNYNLAGTLEMQSEDLPSFFGSRRITWPRATTGVIGRPTGLQLGTSGSPTNDQSVTWGYDTYGRFNSFAGGGTTLAYTYTTNSNLLASVADSTSGWTQTRTYLSNRDLLDIIETKISTTSKAKFDYAHDNLGRRTSVNKTGDLYSRYGNGSQGLDTAWGYDDRSQVTSEQTKLGGSATVLTGRDDAYAFDNIGNRATATHNSQLTTYTSTLLNTYSQRTVPGVFDVAGAAGSGTTVTVNGSSSGVTRHGEYFFNGQSMSNGSGAVFSTLAVSDGTTATNLGAFLAGTPEAFSYDDDGNLLSDGRWDYVYDAENRLVSMQTHTALSPTPLANADARRIEFKSDYLGRRVQKTVRDGWNGSTFATVVSDEKFVYDGWNCIAKLNASSLSLIASYFWGLDWSGTLQGAGGVGGLALTVEGGNTYLPVYDGNGNVMGMIKASSGSIEAAYEYDAFGNTLRESGTYAASNSFRFSTKYTDIETGLVYYGLRYYSPSLGRFINKDPIEEQGGLNLYGFCSNNAINKWDYLGMVVPPDWWTGTEDDYADYLNQQSAINPYEGTDGSLNGFGSSWFQSMGDIYVPTISYDAAIGMGLKVNGGEILNLLTFSNGSQLITQNDGLAPLNQRTTVADFNRDMTSFVGLAAIAAQASGSGGQGGQASGTAPQYSLELKLTIAQETGAGTAVAAKQVQYMQDMLNVYSTASGAPGIKVSALYKVASIAAPEGGQWVFGNDYSALLKRIGGSDSIGVIYASSPVVRQDPSDPKKFVPTGGFGGPDLGGAIISVNRSPTSALAHEIGHVIRWNGATRDPDPLNAGHSTDPNNVMFRGGGQNADSDYYDRIRARATPVGAPRLGRPAR